MREAPELVRGCRQQTLEPSFTKNILCWFNSVTHQIKRGGEKENALISSGISFPTGTGERRLCM